MGHAVPDPNLKPAPPHGGKLVCRIPERKVCMEYHRRALRYPKIALDSSLQSDLLLLATGAYSPLEGFMGEKDYLSVLENMCLSNRLPWTLPVVLPLEDYEARRIKVGDSVALIDKLDQVLGILHVTEKYRRDKRKEMVSVLGTEDRAHPGVCHLHSEGDMLLGGPIWLLRRPSSSFADYERDPAAVRQIIAKREWKTVVGFQTRNPTHLGHEFLIRSALEKFDGILFHPLVGPTRSEDVPASVRMACYRAMMDHHFPSERIILSAFPGAMRYAGPREAIFHALVRKNYGCTHFIVGRDHAGVNGFYPEGASRDIFLNSHLDLGIQPLFFDSVFYCSECGTMASEKTCPHDLAVRVSLSGTELRNMLRAGQKVPREWVRPEVARIMQEFYQEKQTAS